MRTAKRHQFCRRTSPPAAAAALFALLKVDVQRCMRTDERRFPADYFELSGNGCACLHGNTLAITSVSTGMA
jgi:hypothetical protein